MRLTQTLTALMAAGMMTSVASAEDFDVDSFDAVKASAGVDVTVTIGDDHSVRLTSDADPENAKVEVRNGTLTLSRKRSNGLRLNFGRDVRYVYEVTMPSITSAATSSGADMAISGIDAESLNLSASSGSDLIASGTCGSATASATSGSDVEAFDLSCENVTASANSGGDVKITATSSITASANSGGDVIVRGNPESRQVSENSGGNVSIRN